MGMRTVTDRISVRPELLRWACERAGKDVVDYAGRFPKLDAWLRTDEAPTLKQLEQFAAATHTPLGFLLLDQPPVEKVPIPDFRTITAREVQRPSPDLLETIYVCQQRQEWYREFARTHGAASLAFSGSARVADDVVTTAQRIREVLQLGLAEQQRMSTWEDALRWFIGQADAAGVMVMCSGVVLNNNRRRLDPEEFRGFALADDLAPLIFINGADTKAAQMFTLAHELAHVWLGQSGVSSPDAARPTSHDVERWCNRVAAELLVPLAAFRETYDRRRPVADEMARLARYFKVSTLVVLRRMHDAGGLTREQFGRAYERERARLLEIVRRGGGGNFYLTQAARVSKRFARALVGSTLEGETLYREAFRLLGFSKHETFRKLGESLGVT